MANGGDCRAFKRGAYNLLKEHELFVQERAGRVLSCLPVGQPQQIGENPYPLFPLVFPDSSLSRERRNIFTNLFIFNNLIRFKDCIWVSFISRQLFVPLCSVEVPILAME
jgi:hypothetical protein